MVKPKVYKSEKDVKKAVKKIFDDHGWFWWMPPANMYGQSGISDFHAVRDGVFMAVETKFAKNTPTALQKGFLTSVESESAFAFVVRETTVEYFAAFMDAFSRSVDAQRRGTDPAPEDGAMMVNAIKELTSEY